MPKADLLPSSFRVLLWIRDAATTKGSDRLLLIALALRANKERMYSSFPSYQLLAKDCQLDVKTVKLAAQRLEKAHLIKRKVRHNRSNVFYVNVGLLQEQAETNRRAKEELRASAVAPDDEEGFGDPGNDSKGESTESSDSGRKWMTGGGRKS